MTDEKEHKPCAHCGAEGKLVKSGRRCYYIQCTQCGAMMYSYFSPAGVWQAWDRRTTDEKYIDAYGRWHPWPEEKPLHQDEILVLKSNGGPVIGFLDDDGNLWEAWEREILSNVTHWRELPPGPEENT